MRRIGLCGAVVAAALISASVPAENPPVAKFKIELNLTAEGVEMSCSEGCVWDTLGVGCKADEPCRFSIDAHGMTEQKLRP